jgi:hypothetical protein
MIASIIFSAHWKGERAVFEMEMINIDDLLTRWQDCVQTGYS